MWAVCSICQTFSSEESGGGVGGAVSAAGISASGGWFGGAAEAGGCDCCEGWVPGRTPASGAVAGEGPGGSASAIAAGSGERLQAWNRHWLPLPTKVQARQ